MRLLTATAVLLSATAGGHAISDSNAQFVESLDGPAVAVFTYLGAKHMFTGIDHLLFLLGVIFFLYRLRDVILYVSMFTVGHSITLMLGVLADWQVDASIVDAIIGISVVYKAFDNLDGFRSLFGFQPNVKAAVLVFGLFHGLGLATKLQEIVVAEDGLVINLVSFNVGVELGQIAALVLVLGALAAWRRTASFQRTSVAANGVIMSCGFMLAGYHFASYLTT